MDFPVKKVPKNFEEAVQILQKSFGIDWEELFTLRKSIHMEPELGFEELKTKEKIIRYLQKHGAEKEKFRYFAKTGFTYDVTGIAAPKSEKYAIGYRSELDGLCMQELNTFPHASKIPNRAHMCGHDGHMATLMGFANIILNYRHALPSNKTIRLIFQPAEEDGNGGDVMVKEGCLEGLDEVFALHVFPLPYGIFSTVQDKACTIGYLKVEIKLESTAESPLNCAMTAACIIHNQLHCISTLDLLPDEIAILTICQMEGDESMARLQGTIRAELDDSLTKVSKNIEKIVSATAKLYHLKDKVIFSLYTPPVYNAKIPSKYLNNSIVSLYGSDNIVNFTVQGTEDFGYMTKTIPGAMMAVGNRLPGEELIMVHSPYFEYQEKIIPPSIQIYLKLADLRLGASFLNEAT